MELDMVTDTAMSRAGELPMLAGANMDMVISMVMDTMITQHNYQH